MDSQPRYPSTHAVTGVKRGDYTDPFKANQQEACEWSGILGEANELAGLHERTHSLLNPSVVPEGRRHHRGGKGGSKLKFSNRSLSSKGERSRDCSFLNCETYNSYEDDIEGPTDCDFLGHGTRDVVPQLLENNLEESVELVNKTGFPKQLVAAPSVLEMLEDMQKTEPSSTRMAVNNIRAKAMSANSSKRASLHLGNRVLDNKDALEFIGDISSEDEHLDGGYQTAPNVKGQTMVDLFQETFNASAEERAGISGSDKSGFHGKLKSVMQLEKDRHMNYLKDLQTGKTPKINYASPDESSSISARILSRTLEAKLTVCLCLLGENTESAECGFEKGGTVKKTIIFSPTFCGNVELEVGKTVCIQPPWKEVQVNEGESIILCTYFLPLFRSSCDE